MANSDLRKFYFYSEYLWEALDFGNHQTYTLDTIAALQTAGFSKAALSGLDAASSSGMAISISAGVAFNENGYPMVLGSNTEVTIASPVANPARTLVVLRPNPTDVTYITDPTNPGGPLVPLQQKLGVSLVVLNGTASPTPSYPATQAGDVVLFGLRLSAGHSVITNDDIDYSLRDVIKKHSDKMVRFVTSNYNCLSSDDYIEAEGGVTVTLAPASTVYGKSIKVIKSDAGVSPVSVFSGDLISGATAWDLATQYSAATFMSNGVTYNII